MMGRFIGEWSDQIQRQHAVPIAEVEALVIHGDGHFDPRWGIYAVMKSGREYLLVEKKSRREAEQIFRTVFEVPLLEESG